MQLERLTTKSQAALQEATEQFPASNQVLPMKSLKMAARDERIPIGRTRVHLLDAVAARQERERVVREHHEIHRRKKGGVERQDAQW